MKARLDTRPTHEGPTNAFKCKQANGASAASVHAFRDAQSPAKHVMIVVRIWGRTRSDVAALQMSLDTPVLPHLFTFIAHVARSAICAAEGPPGYPTWSAQASSDRSAGQERASRHDANDGITLASHTDATQSGDAHMKDASSPHAAYCACASWQ